MLCCPVLAAVVVSCDNFTLPSTCFNRFQPKLGHGQGLHVHFFVDHATWEPVHNVFVDEIKRSYQCKSHLSLNCKIG